MPQSWGNRVDDFLSEKLEAYHKGLGKAREEFQAKSEKIESDCLKQIEEQIVEYCQQGRLDTAGLFYKMKTRLERGEPVEDEAAGLPDGKEKIVSESMTLKNEIEEARKEKIRILNNSLQSECEALLTRARSMPKEKTLSAVEFNELIYFAWQFPLPEGATLPETGERVGGLMCNFHMGTFNKLDELKKRNPQRSFFSTGIGLPWGISKRDFALVWEGLYYAEKSGVHEFSLRSDDRSRLLIDDKLIINNDNAHDPQTATGTVYLEKGWVPFRVEYFQNQEAQELSLMAGIQGEKELQAIPSRYYAAKLDKQ